MLEKDFLTFSETSPDDLSALLKSAAELKDGLKNGYAPKYLEGKTAALIFEKPSTRTRVSFEVGLFQLGAHAVVLSGQDMQLGRGETIEDTGKVLSRYCDAIIIRTFEQEKLKKLAESAAVPVINALSDDYHPCQALADLMTVKEKKSDLKGLKFVYLGDGNNVCHSLLLACAVAGMNITAACPKGYTPDPKVVKEAKDIASESGTSIVVTDDAYAAAKQADVLYTDVWVSMGDNDDVKARMEALRPYRIDEEIMSVAKVDVLVMHCLPAHRGQEIDADVLDGPNSVVFDQAENRLHAQKALMVKLMAKEA